MFVFCQIWEILSCYFFEDFFSATLFLLIFWDFNHMNFRCFIIISQVSETLFIPPSPVDFFFCSNLMNFSEKFLTLLMPSSVISTQLLSFPISFYLYYCIFCSIFSFFITSISLMRFSIF